MSFFNSVIMADMYLLLFFFFSLGGKQEQELSGIFNLRVELPSKSWLDVG